MDDNEFNSLGELGNVGESGSELRNNGVYSVEDVNDKLLEEINIRGTAVVSPSVTVVPLEGIGSLSLSTAVDKRRQGLKKWRRIPRELAKKIGSNSSLVQQAMLNANGDHPVQPDFSTAVSDLNRDDSVTVLPDDHQRNGGIGPEKKARDYFRIEKENSNSNSTMGVLGSDSGRSNCVFVQGGNTVASKGGQSGSVAEHGEESSDDKYLNEESQTAFIKSDAESDDVSLAADDIEKHEGSLEHDPLVESIKGLYSAQKEFEREVQKWRDVGKDHPLIFNDPIHEILELKDARISELELALSSDGIMTDLEDSLMKIIQADVENVVISTTTKALTEGPLREIKHSSQQRSMASQDVQTTDGTVETKESVKKLQHRVCRFTSCFMIQMILLLVTFYLKFSPQTVQFVPT